MSISHRLASLHKVFGYTLEDIEKKTGIGKSSLSEFETGKREPSISQLAKLAELYAKPLSYFFAAPERAGASVLWRDKPAEAHTCAQIEAKFLKLCTQYRNLEVWTKTHLADKFEHLMVRSFPARDSEVRECAREIGKIMELGARPGETLLRVLEEAYNVKVFHIELKDMSSSACYYSPEIGPAIMLNSCNVPWRRNFDLAHELFHLITWNVRVSSTDNIPSATEETFANVFASTLLMPEDAVRSAINEVLSDDNTLSYNDLDGIARQFAVSIDALCRRIEYVYCKRHEEIKDVIEKTKAFSTLPERQHTVCVETLPSRYKALAVVALNEGEISSSQFAHYMDISVADINNYCQHGNMDAIKINFSTM